MADTISVDGTWNCKILSNNVPRETVDAILNIPFTLTTSLEDKICWMRNGTGKFSVGSCYEQIVKSSEGMISDFQEWKWLWNKKLPNRIIPFLGLLRHKKFLANKACVVRGIRRVDMCKSCSYREDEEHIFMGCFKAK